MEFIVAMLVGLIIGVIAKFLTPGRDPGGVIITALLGIAGSITANYIGHSMGFYSRGHSAGLVASVLGAMLLLSIYRILRGKRGDTPR